MSVDETRPSLPFDLEDAVVAIFDLDGGARSAALDVLCRDHPNHARALRDLHARLTRFGTITATDEVPEAASFGPFELRGALGRGSFGTVFRAVQHDLDREIALKVLRMGAALDPRQFLMFQREARAIARLRHPGIVTLFEAGEYEGSPYLAMDYVDGQSLGAIVRKLQQQGDPSRLAARDLAECIDSDLASTPPFNGRYVDAVCHLVAEIADALQHAHDHGVVHRDVKPSNAMVGRDGHIRLLDFGLARLHNEPGMTQTGDLIGSPLYMAPEQMPGSRDEVDARTDVYGLGVVLFELMTLRVPFTGTTTEQVLGHIRDSEPPRLRRFVPRIPLDVETICLTALEKRPDRRYRSAAELGEELRRFLRDEPIQRRPISAVRRVTRWAYRRRRAIAIGAIPVLVALAALVTATVADEQSHAKSLLRRAEAALSADPPDSAAALDFAVEAAERDRDLARDLVLLRALEGAHRRRRFGRVLDDESVAPADLEPWAGRYVGAAIAAPDYATVALFDRRSGELVERIAPGGTVYGVHAIGDAVAIVTFEPSTRTTMVTVGTAEPIAIPDSAAPRATAARGRRLAIAADDRVRVVDVGRGTVARELDERAVDVAFTADGGLVTRAEGRTPELWAPGRGRATPLSRLDGAIALDVDSSGRFVAAALNAGAVVVHDLQGDRHSRLETSARWTELALSTGGELIACADDRRTLVFDRSTGSERHALPAKRTKHLAFDRSAGSLLQTEADGRVHEWRLETWLATHTLAEDSARLLGSTRDRTWWIRRGRLHSRSPDRLRNRALPDVRGTAGGLHAALGLVVVLGDEIATLLPTDGGAPRTVAASFGSVACYVAPHRAPRSLCITAAGRVQLWTWPDPGAARGPLMLAGKPRPGAGAAFAPDDDRIVVWDRSGPAMLYAGRGQLIGPVPHSAGAIHAEFSPDSTQLLTIAGSARTHDLAGASSRLDTGPAPTCGCYLAGDTIAIGTERGAIQLWRQGRLAADLDGETDAPVALLLAHGPLLYAHYGDLRQRVFDTAAGRVIHATATSERVERVEFLGDDRFVTVETTGRIRLWPIDLLAEAKAHLQR